MRCSTSKCCMTKMWEILAVKWTTRLKRLNFFMNTDDVTGTLFVKRLKAKWICYTAIVVISKWVGHGSEAVETLCWYKLWGTLTCQFTALTNSEPNMEEAVITFTVFHHNPLSIPSSSRMNCFPSEMGCRQLWNSVWAALKTNTDIKNRCHT